MPSGDIMPVCILLWDLHHDGQLMFQLMLVCEGQYLLPSLVTNRVDLDPNISFPRPPSGMSVSAEHTRWPKGRIDGKYSSFSPIKAPITSNGNAGDYQVTT